MDLLKLNIKFYIFDKKIYEFNKEYKFINLISNGSKKNTNKKNKNFNNIIKLVLTDVSNKKTNIKVRIGLSNVILTSYALTIISTIISKYLMKYVKYKNIKKVKYVVIPNYNDKCIIFSLTGKIRLITILKLIFQIRNNRRKKDGRTSN